MRVVSKRTLEAFWGGHADAERALRDWHSLARRATWSDFADVWAEFPTADLVLSESGRKLVFNIRDNRYRLVCLDHFDKQRLYVLWLGSHAEYDRIDVKDL